MPAVFHPSACTLLLVVAITGCGSTAPSGSSATPRPGPQRTITCTSEEDCRAKGMDSVVKEAFEENVKTCKAGDQKACASLAVMYMFGTGTAVDKIRAGELATTACERRIGLACTLLGLMDMDNPEHALRMFGRACDLGDGSGCSNLGILYQTGRGVAASEARGLALLIKGCGLDDALGCTNLGNYYHTREPPEDGEAFTALSKACKLESAQGCNNLADLTANGRGTRADRPRAMGLYKKGCDLGAGAACVVLGASVYSGADGLEADPVKASKLFARGCELAESSGCVNLGQLHLHGEGVAADDGKALELFVKACDLDSGPGCMFVAAMHASGRADAIDDARAREYLEKACKLGVSEACDAL